MFVRDRDILDRIGCRYGDHTFVVRRDGAGDAPCDDGIEDVAFEDMCMMDDVDNSHCDAEFEKPCDGYSGTPGFMRGVLVRRRKNPGDRFSEDIGIYSADGMYRMESARGVTAYLGNGGRALCLAIPQCKMMNSTVLDGEWVRQPVYVGGVYDPSVRSSIVDEGFALSHDVGEAVQEIEHHGMACDEGDGMRHVPFDLWCVMGAVWGKALRIWRGVARLDWKRMPCWTYVEMREVFEALNPGCDWNDLGDASRLEWTKCIVACFRRLCRTSLAGDIPNRGTRRRDFHMCVSMLENSMVSRRVERSREKACVQEWGDAYEPCGFKVRLRGSMLFDFCWRLRVNSPSVVQIRRYEHDVRKVLGTKGWTRCFHMIWASWLVQYRNYWKRRGGGYASCELEWSQREMLHAFRGSEFEIRHLSTEEMVRSALTFS